MKDELLCEGCGCSKKRCDYYPPPAVKCCPDCKHVYEAQTKPTATLD